MRTYCITTSLLFKTRERLCFKIPLYKINFSALIRKESTGKREKAKEFSANLPSSYDSVSLSSRPPVCKQILDGMWHTEETEIQLFISRPLNNDWSTGNAQYMLI